LNLGRPQSRDHRHRKINVRCHGLDHDALHRGGYGFRRYRARHRSGVGRRPRLFGVGRLVTGTLGSHSRVHPILVTLGTMSVIDGRQHLSHARHHHLRAFPTLSNGSATEQCFDLPAPFLLLVIAAAAVGLVSAARRFSHQRLP